jgi:ppGpp synthetase/RelA/SpoT-type nucleotidyltranferase
MNNSDKLEEFLQQNRIEPEKWKRSGLSWDTLQAIAVDHEQNKDSLNLTAEFIAKTIQSFKGVHSVRWRVKNTDHLLEKIIRKAAADNEKYRKIDITNYFDCVSDLVGVRALHLFKNDCFTIDKVIKNKWNLSETPIAYVREGDDKQLNEQFSSAGLDAQVHTMGYRSIHYNVKTSLYARPVITEIQVRTIFEEAWSEIDHTVRYPNFSENPLVGYFLQIFNRLSGSADEMGSFVQSLVLEIDNRENEIAQIRSDRQQALDDMERTVSELENLRQQDANSKESILRLRNELNRMKSTNLTEGSLSAAEAIGRSGVTSSWASIMERSALLSDYRDPISSVLDEILKRKFATAELQHSIKKQEP